MATLPSWLNVTPQMFLQAAQAGGAQGLQVAQMRQQAAQQEAARQAAAAEMSQRLQMSREAALMDQMARQQAAQQEGRALDIRERLGMAELAMREAENRNTQSIRGEANELRRLELERGVASDAVNRARVEEEIQRRQAAQSAADKAIAEIMAGASARDVAMKYPDSLMDLRIKEMLKLEESGPVAPPGGRGLRPPGVPLSPAASTNAPTPFIIRGVR